MSADASLCPFEAPLYDTLCETESGDPELQRIVALAARACNAPIAAFFQRVDDCLLLVKAAYGIDVVGRLKRSSGCCGKVMVSRVAVIIDDLKDLAEPSEMWEQLGARFFAGVPVEDSNGVMIGVLAVLDTVPRRHQPDSLIQIISGFATVICDSLRLKTAIVEREKSDQTLRRQEETLRVLANERTAILDNLPSHVAMIDGDGVIEFVNRQWRNGAKKHRFLGSQKRVGDSYTSKCVSNNPRSPEHAAEVGAAIRQVLSGSSSFEDRVYAYETESGLRWFRFFAVQMRRGSRVGAVLIHEDITEIKRAEQEMRAAKQQIEVANKTKSEFLANMSHELRTPLNAIIGFADLMMNGVMGPIAPSCYGTYVSDIKTSGEHLLSLITDILDLSKIEAGTFKPDTEPVNLSMLIGQAERLLMPRAAKKGVSIGISSKPLDIIAMVDRRSMLQTLINLMSNAVKFSPAGGLVSISAEGAADGALVISVQDEGIGMDANDIVVALEPFRQIENPLIKTAEGTGLGLPIAQRMVEAHGGRLEIQSARRIGTTAKICLPPGTTIKSSDNTTVSATMSARRFG